MSTAQVNKKFFALTDAATHDEVLSAVAKHYGITADEALIEIMHEETEHLLDYLTGTVRAAISVLMRKHGLVAR